MVRAFGMRIRTSLLGIFVFAFTSNVLQFRGSILFSTGRGEGMSRYAVGVFGVQLYRRTPARYVKMFAPLSMVMCPTEHTIPYSEMMDQSMLLLHAECDRRRWTMPDVVFKQVFFTMPDPLSIPPRSGLRHHTRIVLLR
jgi:hypothetical protein